jgi:hypothetical protein
MSDRVKICEVCRHENDENSAICASCGQPISHIVAVEPLGEVLPDSTPSPSDIICPKCGEKNQAPTLICSRCQAVLPRSGLNSPVPAADSPAEERFEVLIGNHTHECKDGDIIGRDGTIACHLFQSLLTVSGQHVKVLKKDGRWCIVMLSGQTTTQIDGRPLRKGQIEFVTGEHRLRLSSQCEISLRLQTPTRSH